MSSEQFEAQTFDPSDALDTTFAAVFDALVPSEDGAENAAGADTAGADAGAAGFAAAPAEATGPAGADAPVGTVGAGGNQPVPSDGSAASGAPVGDSGLGSAAGAVDFATIRDDFGKISVALEENAQGLYRDAALHEVQSQYGKYFEVLKQHPRTLVGQQVPSFGREGMETLRDSQDAQDWQNAAKQLLSEEVRDRAARLQEDDSDTLSMIHSSIELFQNNPDLIPGVRQFDRELANQFAALAKPYEMRANGKLNGYSIPVQPLVDRLRAQLATSREAAKRAQQPPPQAPAAAGRPGVPKAASAPAPRERGPQAGIQSKAGESSEEENYDVLFGTIGLPTLRI